MSWTEQIGTLHIHTRYSDGTGGVGEILRAARGARLDYIVLSDHDSLAARREGWEGIHDGVALLPAVEITPRRAPHALAMNVRHCEGYATRPAREAMDGIAAQGGYVIVAHPMGKRRLTLGIHHRPWLDWAHPAIRGMEIWSYMYDWVDGVAWWRLPLAYQYWRNPQQCVRGPEVPLLRQWDRLGRERRMAGWGGLDCHARRLPIAGVGLFPYAQMFQFLRNHVFIPAQAQGGARVAALWDALANGRGFVAHDFLADARGTRGEARHSGGVAQMGEEVVFQPGMTLALRLPRRAEIRWIENGRRRLTALDERLEVRPAAPGVHRFEAWLDGAPWLFTNPFYLRAASPSSRAS